MQTPAEKMLIDRLARFLDPAKGPQGPKPIINLGAGKSLSIERLLEKAGADFIADRVDAQDCSVSFPKAGRSFVCSVEAMSEIPSESYDAAFANYLLEHVEDLFAAAHGIRRILVKGGMLFATAPNPKAPEFWIARHTPLWFHKLVRGKTSWETKYAYQSIPALIKTFAKAGLLLKEVRFFPFALGYLHRFPILNFLAKIYDKTLNFLNAKSLMGNVCLIFERASK